MSLFKKEILVGLLMLMPSAWAGIDSGGTLTICGQPFEEWSVSMSEIVGYDRYRAVIDKLKNDVPSLALRLSDVENRSWFYPPCDPGKITDKSLDIPTNKAIAYYDNFLVAFEWNLKTMRDPGKALLHEAVRNLCHTIYPSTEQASQETNCTLRNSDLIYNKYGKGLISGSELISSLVNVESYACGNSVCGSVDSSSEQLNFMLEYLRQTSTTVLAKLGETLQKACGAEQSKNDVDLPGVKKMIDEIRRNVPAIGYISVLVQANLSDLYPVFGITGWWSDGRFEVDCSRVAKIPDYLNKLQADFKQLDAQALGKRYMSGKIFEVK